MDHPDSRDFSNPRSKSLFSDAEDVGIDLSETWKDGPDSPESGLDLGGEGEAEGPETIQGKGEAGAGHFGGNAGEGRVPFAALPQQALALEWSEAVRQEAETAINPDRESPTRKDGMVDKEKKAKGRKGIRYTPEQKKEILDYIKANPGRGAMKDAQEKFGVSYVAIRNWMQETGEGVKTLAVKQKVAKHAPGEYDKFEGIKALVEEIGVREKELKALYARVNKLLTT